VRRPSPILTDVEQTSRRRKMSKHRMDVAAFVGKLLEEQDVVEGSETPIMRLTCRFAERGGTSLGSLDGRTGFPTSAENSGGIRNSHARDPVDSCRI